MYMMEMIQERVGSNKIERRDLFSSLLEASSEFNEAGEEPLNNDELIGAPP